jgi:uncharacterized protein (TIGR04206 family)
MDDGSSPRRRLAAVACLGLLPWTVVLLDGEASFVFGFGLANTNPLTLVNLYDYLFVYTGGLPGRLQAWPAGVVLYVGALASAVGGLLSVEDPRLTGGLLVCAGLSHGHVAYGLYRVYGTSPATVLPVGAVTTWAVAWWFYWPLVRKRGLAA